MPGNGMAATASTETLVDPFAAVRPGLLRVDEALRAAMAGSGAFVEELGTYLLAGGKRLRPALVLLSGEMAGAATQDLIPVATACEIIHMATLVHDDLIDASDRRRGKPTMHAKWGLAESVLMGDHLFARGFSLLAGTGDPRVVRVMSDVVARTCSGEIDEVAAQWDLDVTLDGYRARVHGKTGFFIAECCRLGAIVGNAPAEWLEALSQYGAAVGDCFQIVDDLLDLTASPEVLGKPTGSDLRAGVYTLPVVWTLAGKRGDDLRSLLARRPVDDKVVAEVLRVLEVSGALTYAAREATKLAQRAQTALTALPPSPQVETLAALAQALVHRVR